MQYILCSTFAKAAASGALRASTVAYSMAGTPRSSTESITSAAMAQPSPMVILVELVRTYSLSCSQREIYRYLVEKFTVHERRDSKLLLMADQGVVNTDDGRTALACLAVLFYVVPFIIYTVMLARSRKIMVRDSTQVSFQFFVVVHVRMYGQRVLERAERENPLASMGGSGKTGAHSLGSKPGGSQIGRPVYISFSEVTYT